VNCRVSINENHLNVNAGKREVVILKINFFMKQYHFKTNINCSGCVAAVTPHLDQETSIKKWNVDTADPNKLLTVETDSLQPEQVSQLVQKAGFKAQQV
jgi:copper chaperone